jgi:DNA uptake protein ComE-like DNA-binding protein
MQTVMLFACKEIVMKKLLKGMGLLAGTALLAAGLAHAKDDAKTSAPSNKNAASTSASAPASEDKSKMAQVNINTATEKELAALPKIGDVKAKAIIKGRPYKSKDQLVDKKILSQDAYDSIKDQIIAKQGATSKDAAKDTKKETPKETKK